MHHQNQKIWRSANLNAEEKCVIIKEYISEHGRFSIGEIVSFIDESYSRYDNSSVYRFRSNDDAMAKPIFINDDEIGIETYFERISQQLNHEHQ